MEAQQTQALHSTTTKQNPCRVLYLPELNKVVAACYTYDSTNGTRAGSLEIFDPSLNSVLCKDGLPSGVLSLSTFNTANSLLLGCSDGTLVGYDVKASPGNSVELTHTLTRSFGSKLVLHHSFNKATNRACVGLSDGSVAFTNNIFDEHENIETIKAHKYEVWAVHQPADYHNVVLSGSDDTLMKMWDLSTGSLISVTSAHTAGICMIKDGPQGSQTVLTGCYDGYIRVWDMRKMFPSCVAKIKVGEQCWDFMFKETEEEIILGAACIYDAAYLAKCSKNWDIISKAKFEQHKSIVYGIDFIASETEKAKEKIVTCSFYDKNIYIWH